MRVDLIERVIAEGTQDLGDQTVDSMRAARIAEILHRRTDLSGAALAAPEPVDRVPCLDSV